jgi:hypothetical protein
MNARGAELLVNPHPCGHIVYPYADEGLVRQAVTSSPVPGFVTTKVSSSQCQPIIANPSKSGGKSKELIRMLARGQDSFSA